MNVIMPTAMSSIHQDPELRECASKTAINGKKILRLLKDSEDVKMNCNAISSVCTGDSSGADEKLVQVSGMMDILKGYSRTRNCFILRELCSTIFGISKSLPFCFFAILQYWNKFFVNYNYEAEQKEGIANAIFEFC